MTSLGYTISRNCIGKVKEIAGVKEHPAIRWAFDISGLPNAKDDTEAWCGAWQGLTSMLGGEPLAPIPGRARSWLSVGRPVHLIEAAEGDTIILTRGEGPQPGQEVINAPGHVGRFVRYDAGSKMIEVLGGNQKNEVSLVWFPVHRLLGLRRVTN